MTDCEWCNWPIGPGEDYRKDGDVVCRQCSESDPVLTHPLDTLTASGRK